MVVETKGGALIEDVPIGYQMIDGQRCDVQINYVIVGDDTLRYEVGEYRRDRELIIDPELIYSTFLKGSGNSYAAGIAVDGSGNAYVAGWTDSSDFPTIPGAYDTTFNGAWDVFVSKIDPKGQRLLYSTFIGGSKEEWSNGIAIDGDGNAYVAGYTYSNDYPPHLTPMIRITMEGIRMGSWPR